ncbi:probable FBD-associated F-box protein At1g32375 [Chenopodium quinoa]|nr:probable FBD-associated F-box protein At1g32375 [Chenopodium quinoa]
MDAIKWRNICELDMNLCGGDPVFLPREFLYGQTLKVLKLGNFYLEDTQNPFYLSDLVDSVGFPGDQFLKRLLVGCPVLKELVVREGCGFDDTIYIESLTLKSLEIIQAILHVEQVIYALVLKHQTLRCITIFQRIQTFCDFDDVTLLSKAKFCQDGCFPVVTTQQSAKLKNKLPILQNLTHLELELENWYELLKCAPKLKSLCFRELIFGKLQQP